MGFRLFNPRSGELANYILCPLCRVCLWLCHPPPEDADEEGDLGSSKETSFFGQSNIAGLDNYTRHSWLSPAF